MPRDGFILVQLDLVILQTYNGRTRPRGMLAPMFPSLLRFSDAALLLLRLMVATVFVASGWKHLQNPAARAKSIGMSKGFTIFLGTAEIAGGLGVAFGVLTQIAALGLILLMLGAIQKKIGEWHTGFWGKDGSGGWHYDLLFVVMNLVIITTNGGRYVLLK